MGVRVDGKRGWGVLLSFTSQTELAAIAERAAAALPRRWKARR